MQHTYTSMSKIEIVTRIKSTADICFDLSRSIDLHKISTAGTNETAIAGTTTGLINLNETVTWEAIHFGIRQQLTSRITAFNRPHHFRDEQVKGIFRKFIHDHNFVQKDDIVIMTDLLEFESPFGIAGRVFNKLILTNYLTKFLNDRNRHIKSYAESGDWRSIIPGN